MSKIPRKHTESALTPHMVAKDGITRSGLSLVTCTAILVSLIQSKWEYALHLWPVGDIIIENIHRVTSRFYKIILGRKEEKNCPRCNVLCRILDPADRRETLVRKIISRAKAASVLALGLSTDGETVQTLPYLKYYVLVTLKTTLYQISARNFCSASHKVITR